MVLQVGNHTALVHEIALQKQQRPVVCLHSVLAERVLVSFTNLNWIHDFGSSMTTERKPEDKSLWIWITCRFHAASWSQRNNRDMQPSGTRASFSQHGNNTTVAVLSIANVIHFFLMYSTLLVEAGNEILSSFVFFLFLQQVVAERIKYWKINACAQRRRETFLFLCFHPREQLSWLCFICKICLL